MSDPERLFVPRFLPRPTNPRPIRPFETEGDPGIVDGPGLPQQFFDQRDQLDPALSGDLLQGSVKFVRHGDQYIFH